MLPKHHRLNLRRTVPFFTFPMKRQNSWVSLYWRQVPDQKAAQAAIVVSKKVAPTAVQRNKIKRVLRALLSSLFQTFSSDVQFVLQVKNAGLLDNLELVKEFIIKNLPTQK
jgi:ribonuclease P protein component